MTNTQTSSAKRMRGITGPWSLVIFWSLGFGNWAFLLGGCASQPTTTQPASPIAYQHEVRVDPKLHLHVVIIDLTDPRVQIRAAQGGDDPDGEGPWQTTLQTVRAIAQRERLDVAVNANFFGCKDLLNVGGRRVPYFTGNWSRAAGWLVCDGRVINSQPAEATLVVDRSGRVRIGRFERLPDDTYQAVSGSMQLVTTGKLSARGNTRVPRTAAGIDRDATRLILAVVDGRLLSHSVGMSEVEMAELMLRLGCHDAINLDGGGSSTLVMRDPQHPEQWKVKNRPSDGHDLPLSLSLERAVACALGVRVKSASSTNAATSSPASSALRPAADDRVNDQ